MGDFIHFVHASELLVGYRDYLNPKERQRITPRSVLRDFLRADVMKIAVILNGKTLLGQRRSHLKWSLRINWELLRGILMRWFSNGRGSAYPPKRRGRVNMSARADSLGEYELSSRNFEAWVACAIPFVWEATSESRNRAILFARVKGLCLGEAIEVLAKASMPWPENKFRKAQNPAAKDRENSLFLPSEEKDIPEE